MIGLKSFHRKNFKKKWKKCMKLFFKNEFFKSSLFNSQMSLYYTGGDVCDGTNKPRAVEVKLK